jgi:hypothetical protein
MFAPLSAGEGLQAGIAGQKNGRPDCWLCVGGTKAGPTVLLAVSLGGAPNGHEASGKIGPLARAGKGPAGIKIVMECRQSASGGEAANFFDEL